MLFAKDFGNFCFPKIHCRKYILRKNLCFPEKFFKGGLEWKGAQILEYTPQPETGWHGPECSPVPTLSSEDDSFPDVRSYNKGLLGNDDG